MELSDTDVLRFEGPDYRIEEVEVAGSLLKKMKGLMGREEGRMLLAYGHTSRHPVWMPFMQMSIDCICLDEDWRVVSCLRGLPPMGLDPRTWRSYRPARPCRYVLEVEAGLVDRLGIDRGDRLRPTDRS